MKNKKRYVIYFGIIVLSICISIVASFFYQQYKNENIPNTTKKIKIKETIPKEIQEEKYEEPITYTNELPGYREQYKNPNIVGKLELPNLNINTLITRAENNSFYLNNNIYNQYDGLGVPFLDYRNTDLVNNKQLNIYGHNTQNEKFFSRLPFINLESYIDKNIFNNYKDIYLSIDEKKIHYEVIAIKIITAANNEHMKVEFNSDEEYLRHVSKLLQDTLYRNNNLEITPNNHLIVLQVCHYDPPDTYLLVIGREK